MFCVWVGGDGIIWGDGRGGFISGGMGMGWEWGFQL